MRVPIGGDGTRTVKVKSSDKVTVYLVRWVPGGLWTCTCPGFAHRSTCRHIKAVRSRITEDVPSSGDLL